MSDSIASLTNYHQSPRKVRLVADLVRGKTVERALAVLSVLPKRASEPMAKLIQSAVANAQTNGKGSEGSSASDLVISRIEVNGGVVFKRSMPRARGRASQILKRTSHVTLALTRRGPVVAKAPRAQASK